MGLYRIGGRRPCGFKGRLCLLLIALLLAAFWLNIMLYPHIAAQAEAHITNLLSQSCAEVIGAQLEEGTYRYEDLIQLKQDTTGKVQALQADMIRMQQLRYKIAQALLQKLQQITYTPVSIPLGNLSGLLLLAGRGGHISLSVQTVRKLLAGFSTEFTSVGFNQTMHTVYLQFDIQVDYLLPLRSGHIPFTDRFAIAQTVIVGEVPDSLTQINRFTQEMEEIEIDDAVDFGNVLS